MLKKIIALTLICIIALTNTGCENPFIDAPSTTPDPYAIQIHTKDNLEDGCYYIKHGEEFYEIPYGEQSFYKNEETDADYILPKDELPDATRNWFYRKEKDELIIPTLYQDDSIVYKTQDTINSLFEWERFSDDGYTIGLRGIGLSQNGSLIFSNYAANLLEDGPFAKVIERVDETDSEIYRTFTINAINSKTLTEEDVSDGGFIKSLETGKELTVTFYAGTEPYTVKTEANVRAFSNFENYWTKDIQYQNGYVEITVPKAFKSGYYKTENSGLFRYVDKPYSKEIDITKINYNEPYFEKDESGMPITTNPDTDEYLY